MNVWCVMVIDLHDHCHECDGGGDADYYFVAAPSRRGAMDLVFERRMHHVDNDWDRSVEERRRDDNYKAFKIRPWRGKATRFVRLEEVEL